MQRISGTGHYALKRTQFYEDMAKAEAALRADPVAWAAYVSERDAWLNPELTSAP